MNIIIKILAALSLIITCSAMDARELRFANIFGDKMVLQQDSDVNIWGYGKPGAKIVLSSSWDSGRISATVSETGKWQVSVHTPAASFEKYSISVRCRNESVVINDVMVGEVWLCSGQSNMEMIMRPDSVWRLHVENAEKEIESACSPGIRFTNVFRNESYDVRDDAATGGWLECYPENVQWLSAVAWYFALELQDKLEVPIGLIVDSYGGSPIQSWLPEAVISEPFYSDELSRLEEHKAKGLEKPEYDMASSLFNGMLYPVAGYGIRGFLWYQGCSNVSDAARYPKMMKDLVNAWRALWGQELPFYHVQIAPFMYPAYQSGRWAELACAQHAVTSELGKSGIVITADIGDPENIHPGKKKQVGKRLADMALNNDYGVALACCSPEPVSACVENGEVLIEFDHADGGLTCSSDGSEFEVSSDGVLFSRARPEVRGNKIILSSSVRDVRYVRYCWRDNSRSDIHNQSGLPLGPFFIGTEL